MTGRTTRGQAQGQCTGRKGASAGTGVPGVLVARTLASA